MNLEEVKAFAIPRDIVQQTERALQESGSEGYELFVLWSGVIELHTFRIRTAHVPKQKSYRTDDGLLVRVEGPALHELNVWLFENQEILGIQVHAHPTDAFHSQTDNTYPIVTTLGGLSIVAADFAQDGLLNAASAAYRLTRKGWRSIRRPDRSRLIEVVD
jgi:hypothetical protein